MTRLLRILALGVLTGCTDRPEPTAVDIERASEAAAEASVGAPTAVHPGIVELKEAFDAAWAAKDANAFARNYTIHAELVTPLGGVLAGREAIRAQHAFLFSGPFAQVASETTIRRTVFLERDVRIVDVDNELTGFAAPPPDLPQVEPGVVRTRMNWIVVRRADGWKILDQQITAVAPAP